MAPLFANALARQSNRSFERMYERHVRDVYALALGILGNPDDAEDVTQTTFLNAYRALERGDAVANPRAWLSAIAHNVCRQRFRTASRRPQEVRYDAEIADSLADDETPTADEIRDAMRHLAFNQRVVLVMREIEGFSYAEIAAAMELSESAVETLLFRARRALREQLEAAERPLSCGAAERLISLQLDGRLGRRERGALRGHLRACPDCAASARRERAQKRSLKRLAVAPLPATLLTKSGWSLGGALAAKVAAVAAGAAILGTSVAVETGFVNPPWSGARAAGSSEPARSEPERPVVPIDVSTPDAKPRRTSVAVAGRTHASGHRAAVPKHRTAKHTGRAHAKQHAQPPRKHRSHVDKPAAKPVQPSSSAAAPETPPGLATKSAKSVRTTSNVHGSSHSK